ncbi:hypothetical protein [Chondromyces apiculatus]|uniref:Uncharacterized protein n=1 Tax=Chondromyces apiculatus DSM 436 TaxID=1192034 RepID=A0A017T4Q2_9BACT|nr:hypothetical protein [Chondromyces apiculatus]EYF03795.1 Hypothetical protein CAP_5225 [Chondromyces apiculatus DSM 436]
MRFGLPRDLAPWIALGLSALLAAFLAWRRATSTPSTHARPAYRRIPALFLGAAALSAALLSAAYVPVYLRGGPRIIDATSYWLEARALASGHLSWPIEEPAASTLGRFLVRNDSASATQTFPQPPLAADAPQPSLSPSPIPPPPLRPPPDPRPPAQVAVIFPPGYPAVLALGFLAGLPGLLGPLLAMALVLATWDLATRLFPGTSRATPGSPRLPPIPSLAALLSALCAALRYHTADTMSHGLAALCFTASLAFALRALDASRAHAPPWNPALPALLSGLFTGWLAATRPPSALALTALLLWLLARPPLSPSPTASSSPSSPSPAAAASPPGPSARLRLACAMALGALPGLALLALHQRAATGTWMSSQALYYATSDGPPGCFRYGFGADIGCLGEHGDFVRHNLAHGYGALAAAATTLRRLKMHLVDPLNAEPLFVLVLAGAVLAWRTDRTRLLPLALLAQIAAYVPFYFDGNYPAGGARFYADVLPLEHVLAAAALVTLAPRLSSSLSPSLAPGATRLLALAAALSLSGFAFRASFDHAQLRDRDGGAPMFDPAVLARAGITRGLVFVDTDHGFNLGHDPAPGAAVQVLRHRGDALDAMAWEAHGRPPAFRYHFRGPTSAAPASTPPLHAPWLPMDAALPGWLEPLPLDPPDAELHIEGESLWPPRAQVRAWALPEHAAGTCASADRWLVARSATPGEGAFVQVALPSPWLRGAYLSPRVATPSTTPSTATGAIRLLVDGALLHEWQVTSPPDPAAISPPPGPRCAWLEPHAIPEGARDVALILVPLAPEAALFSLDAVRATRANPVDQGARNR